MTRTVSLRFAKRCSLRSSDVTRADTITLDVVLTVLGSDVTSQHLQSTLGSSISRHSLTTQFTHHRADVDNLAVTFLYHRRDNSLGYDKRSVQVYVDHLTEFSSRHFVHRNTLDDTCIVHQNIDHAHFFLNLGNHSVHLLFICHVAYITFSIDAFSFVSSQTFVH